MAQDTKRKNIASKSMYPLAWKMVNKCAYPVKEKLAAMADLMETCMSFSVLRKVISSIVMDPKFITNYH